MKGSPVRGSGHTTVFRIAHELRLGFRRLRRKIGVTAVAILTLSLGIGATAAGFSLVYGVLYSPLPYPEPDRIVVLERALEGDSIDPDVEGTKYLFWKEHESSMKAIGAHLDPRTVTLQGDRPERVRQRPVTAGLAEVLHVEPVIGRSLSDRGSDEDRLAMLSHPFWLRRFGGDLDVLGTILVLEGTGYEVVGVLPPEVDRELAADVWTQFDPARDPMAAGTNLQVIGRLRDDLGIEQAQADLVRVAERLRTSSPGTMADAETVRLVRLKEGMVETARKRLWILMAGAGLILLISCSNVASILSADLVARRQEFAVRAALGGRRHQIMRQLVAEGLCLSLLAGAVGLGVAWLIARLAVRGFGANLPRVEEVTLGGPVVLFTLALTVFTTVVFSLVPTLQLSRRALRDDLAGGSGLWMHGTRRGRVGQAVIVVEAALCVILLVGASLLLRSLVNLWQVDLGFEPDRVLTFQTALDNAGYESALKIDSLSARVVERLEGSGEVSRAAAVVGLPLGGVLKLPLHSVEGRPKPAERYLDTVHWLPVTPGFFEAMGVDLLRGRALGLTDGRGSVPVAVVSASFARKHFVDGDAVGRSLLLGWDMLGADFQEHSRRIVGVVGDMRAGSLDEPARPAVYVPLAQITDAAAVLVQRFPVTFLARTEGDPAAVRRLSATALGSADPRLPVEQMRTMDQVVGESLHERRFQTFVFAVFSLVSLTLVVIGIYGVVSHSVAQRKPEIGVRMALGARPAQVQRSVVTRSVLLTCCGVLLGVPGAIGLSRALESFVYGFPVYEPTTLLGAAVLLCAVAVVTSYVPARAATAMDVMRVLGES